MDQRVKGGTPPTSNTPLPPASPPEDSEQEQVSEIQRRGEGEKGDSGKRGEEKEERRGAGRKKEGDKGAVLELLIEGRCGGAGQQQLQFPGREASCPDGNVRLRIGLQAKRTKKPPKILESYVCKPTIRTYQRQGRTGLLRGDTEGGVGQQSKSNPTPEEASRQSASTASPGLALSSLSLSPALPPLPPASSPASAPATLASPGSKSAKQVPIKLADKTEVNSNGSLEKVKREKVPSVNGQPVPAAHKASPKADQAAPTTPSTPSVQNLSAGEPRSEGDTPNKHNGLVQTGRQKGLSNGKGSTDILSPTKSTKVKVGKHSSCSSPSPRDMDSAARPPVSSNVHKEHSLSHKSRTDSPCSPSVVTPKPNSSPAVSLSSGHSPKQDPSLQPSLEKKREKEKKVKKDKRKEKKSKRDKGEAERAKSEGRKEEGKKKKKEKSRHGKGKDERGRVDDTWRDAVEKIERGKAEKKKDKLSPDRHRAKVNNAKAVETDDSGKLDKTCKLQNPGRPGERDQADDTCQPVKHAEPATTGDTSKSKEQDVPSRHPTVPPSHPSSSAPPSLPALSARSPVSPPSSPPEQDSRPLKKRKARRPSWTKLVHRAQRVENQDTPGDSQHSPLLTFPQNSKTCLPTKTTLQQSDESHPTPSIPSTSSSSSALPSAPKPPSPTQSHPHSDPSPPASRSPIIPARKRGRPKSHTSSLDEPPPRPSPNAIPAEVPALGCEGVQKAAVLEPSPVLPNTTQSTSTPRKRGRPPKRPLPEDQSGDTQSQSDVKEGSEDMHPEKGNRQLKIRRLISEMKKRKKRRLHKGALCEYAGKEDRGGEMDEDTSLGVCQSIEATATHTLSALSSSFGGKLGPQINVSKRGTIYMGKRRGRKPKTQTATLNSSSQNSVQPALFTNPSETSLFSSSQPQLPSHPFPSPSLTHSSGAQSPYSEGSLAEHPTSSLLFHHPFSLPSPSSSCTSPRPPSSLSLSPFVKKSCPCQGRHHFPFHQSSCKLSSPAHLLLHTPGSPAHLKEATPSPRSESHSEDTLPSDSGIGTDNNSVSERGEMRGGRGLLRMGQGSGVILGGQRHPSSLVDHPSPVSSPLSAMHRHPSSLVDRPSPVSSPLSAMHRHTNPIANPATMERHRERHRHRRREYDCVPSCTCLCPCPCPGHNKCTHSDYYPCLGHSALKRPKNKHKKKHQQLLMQDPEFLSELDDMIGQFSEVHIGRRSWARTGLGQGFDGSGNAAGGRRHLSSSSHPLRSNIFRINLNGFYSPHPSSYSTNPSFSPQPFYPCQPVHCGRKPDRRQCGCPSKFQETIDDMGFYRGYPPSAPLYSHLHSSFPLHSPHQYAAHQPHHPHFLLNPARFHRRRSRLLREGGLGGEVEGEMGGGGGGPHLSSGFVSSLSCGCGRSEHKHKHKHRHRHCERDVEDEEEVHDEEEEDDMEREGLASSKSRSGFIVGRGDGGTKATRGMGSVRSTESPWLCDNGKDSFSSSAATASASSSSTSSAERFKHTPLTSIGLGSSHLSSFGGGWGGLGQPWMKVGGLGGPGFGLPSPGWRTFTGGQHTGRMGASDKEEDDDDDEEEEDIEQTHLYRTSPSPTTHTNLFTSAAMATGGRGQRTGMGSRTPGSGDRAWRREEPAWTERRGAGLQGDSRSREQQKCVPAPDGVAVKKKRRPGRPRKQPLPCSPAASPPTPSSTAPPVSAPEEKLAEREHGGGDPVQQVTESVLQAKRKRGRKRKHGDSPCRQSVGEDTPECDDAPPECFDQSDSELEPSPSQTFSGVQWEERDDDPPRKKFLRAGLYSDDYKTTDPPSQAQQASRESMDQAQQASRESMEYIPGERDYSLLPAPINVGKYLRLKRIDFQLPYDVLWLWRNNQLHRQPVVPLKRKRHYCRLKEKTVSPQQLVEESSSDITSFFPHLHMDPLTSTERSFVVKHHVFLVRNWELVRDRQIQLRIERERDREREAEGEQRDTQRLSYDGGEQRDTRRLSYDGGEQRDTQHLSCDGASGDDESHIKSDQPVGVENMVISSDPHCQTQDTSSPRTASPHPTKTQNRREEEREEEKRGEEEVCSRELRRKRLNDFLLTLQQS